MKAKACPHCGYPPGPKPADVMPNYTDAQYKKLLIELHGLKAGLKGYNLWLTTKRK